MSAAEDLARVTAERDALARHIEQLIAPVTETEVAVLEADYRAFPWNDERDNPAALMSAMNKFIAARQRKGQFAALS